MKHEILLSWHQAHQVSVFACCGSCRVILDHASIKPCADDKNSMQPFSAASSSSMTTTVKRRRLIVGDIDDRNSRCADMLERRSIGKLRTASVVIQTAATVIPGIDRNTSDGQILRVNSGSEGV